MSRKRSTQEPDVPLMSDQDEQPFEQDEIKDVLTESDLDIGEDLFASDHENDYKLNSNADKYNSSDIDDRQYDDIDFNVKKLVDLKLNKRDNPRAFDESDDDQPLLIRRRRNEVDMLVFYFNLGQSRYRR